MSQVFGARSPLEPRSPFLEIDSFIYGICGPYEQTWQSGVFALLRYAPYFITIVLYIASFWYKQIYLLFFSIGLTLDGVLNEALNNAFPRAWRTPGCPPLWGAAVAYQIEHAAFFITFVLGYMLLYRPRTKLWHILLLFTFYALTVSGAHYMNFHYADAIANGAIVGSFAALTYQTILHWFFVPRLCRMLKHRLIVYWGYMDTLCTGEVQPLHVLMDENFTREFGSSSSSSSRQQTYIEREKVREFIAKQIY